MPKCLEDRYQTNQQRAKQNMSRQGLISRHMPVGMPAWVIWHRQHTLPPFNWSGHGRILKTLLPVHHLIPDVQILNQDAFDTEMVGLAG